MINLEQHPGDELFTTCIAQLITPVTLRVDVTVSALIDEQIKVQTERAGDLPSIT